MHNIANVSFSFKAYVTGLDKNQLKALIKNFGHGVQDPVEVAGRHIPKATFVREYPKLAIWLTAAEIMACLYVEFEIAELHLQKLGWAEFEKLTSASK